jgi:serine protease
MRYVSRKALGSIFAYVLIASVMAMPTVVGNAFYSDNHGYTKSAHKERRDVIHLKLASGSGVTLENGVFVGGDAVQVAQLNQILSGAGKIKADKLRSGAVSSEAQRQLDTSVSDYYRVAFKNDTNLEAVVASLKALTIVATVYGEPTPAPSPVSPNYSSLESYLQAAPAGINAASASTYSGGNASNVKIFDLEYSWNTSHEDLTKARTALIANGTPLDPFTDNNHGTAVLGEMVADNNAYGVTGAASGASLTLINTNNAERGYDPVGALNKAAAYAKPGDVVIIEQQTWGPTPDTYDFVPIEWIPEVYDAVKALTASGVTVVEPAGNGYQNLDDATYYGTTFPLNKVDSGAIIVGAGENCAAPKLSRLSYSDYGRRVNLQGPGDCVVTTGWYGDLYSAGGVNAYYTSSFSGTSSATPVVAAAAADVSSAYKAKNGVFPTPAQIRSILYRDSTSQNTSVAGNIGPMPDLAKAMNEIFGTTVTLDTTAPSVPANVQIRLNSSGKPVVTWSASTDNVGVKGYKIYRNGVAYSTTAATSFTDSSATRRKTYSYRVAAVDAAGNVSGLSSSVSITSK